MPPPAEFGILGPLRVVVGGEPVVLGAAKLRATLAVLLVHANRFTSLDRLIDELWEERPPRSAAKLVPQYVSQLRRSLRPSRGLGGDPVSLLETRPSGYLLHVGDGALDADRFRAAVEASRRAGAGGDAWAAADGLRQALGLWRGAVLADVPPTPSLAAAAVQLEELRVAAVGDRVEAELALGRHAELIGELSALVAENPLQERLRGQLMRALYRSGRQAEALEAYRAARQALQEELGIEPSRALQQLQQAILAADPALDAGTAGAPVVVAPAPTTAAPGPGTAASVPTAAPAQLPCDVADFTGRRRQLRQLDRLLAAGEGGSALAIRVVAGPGGIGKTALAVHWAHQVRHCFRDGQLYVDLRGYSPAPPLRPLQALANLLHGLGVAAEQVPVELDQAAALYRTMLAGRRMLVVLDNARDADQVRPLLPGGPGCVVLVTSRDRLAGLVARQGARPLGLDLLTPIEARTLLTRVLGAQPVRAEPAATAELARACGYLPLALRIAAANLLGQARPSVAGYVAELGGGNRLATLAVPGDEQTAVRAAFDLSYAALPGEARRLFRLLGSVPGQDFTPAAAAASSGLPPARAGDLLRLLADVHLLTSPAPGRFAFHDLLRIYAAERAAEDPEEARSAARGRLLDWYLQTAGAAACRLYPEKLRLPLPPVSAGTPALAFDDREQALAWLDAERPNLVAAVEQAAGQGPQRFIWLLSDVLRGYFWQCLRTVDWLAVARAGLVAAEADGDQPGQAAAHLSLGDVHRCLSRYDQAIAHYLRSRACSRDAGWVAGEAAALGNLGNAYWRAGRLQEAEEHHTLALALDRQVGSLSGQAASLANLGQVSRELGRLRQAAGYYTQALALDEQIGYRGGWAMDLTTLGEVELVLGHLDEAGRCLGEALALHRELGDRDSEAETLRVLAAVRSASGDHDEARELARAAIGLARDTGNRRIEADALLALALAFQRLGELREAAEVHEQALALARQTSERHSEVEALIGLAVAQHHLGATASARRQAERALALARQAGYRLLEGDARTALATIALERGQTDQAIEQARQALAIHRETGHRPGEDRTLAVLGRAVRRQGPRTP